MTAPKRNLHMAKKDANEWLQWYDGEPNPDPNHPAVRAIRNFALTGWFSNMGNQSLRDITLQAKFHALRHDGKSYLEAVEILAKEPGLSEATVRRRIKPKPLPLGESMPPEIKGLEGKDGLLKVLYVASKMRSKRGPH